MKNQSLKEIVNLSNTFTLKGSFSKQFLFDLRSCKKYSLDSEQFQFLCLCNGEKTLSEILEEYDPESRKTALEFIKNLKKIGAIYLTSKRAPRELTKLAPDPRLQSVHFEITSRCNMKCLHCYQKPYFEQGIDLTFEKIYNLINQMYDLQVENIGISGGEPLLRPDLFEIIRLVEEKEISIAPLFTNGLALDDKVIKKIISCRSRFSVFVSLDGIRPESMRLRGFDSVQGRKALERILINIKTAVNAGIPVSINTMVTKESLPDLYQMYDLFRKIGVKGWRLGLPKKTGAFKEHYSEFIVPWEEALEKYLELIKYHLNEHDRKERQIFNLQIEYLFREELFENFEILSGNDFVCDYEGKRQSCCIKPNGDVTSCAFYTDFPIGNVLRQSLKDIWYSDAMQKMKNVRIRDVEECRSCPLSPICATGCRANAIFLHGSKNSKDDDACIAVKFFSEKVAPFIQEKGVIKKEKELIIPRLD